MKTNNSIHLDRISKINLGSFYSPAKYVNLIGEWLVKYGVDSSYCIADFSCGYGAFFELHSSFSKNTFVGNDIDKAAVKVAKQYFPFIRSYNENFLSGVSRQKYGLSSKDKLVIVGNPPYNDTTSIVGKGIKLSPCHIDNEIKSRDLGISSLLAYSKMEADYVAVLHPLSYLIKETNFKSCKDFFQPMTSLNMLFSQVQNLLGLQIFQVSLLLLPCISINLCKE